MSGLLFLSTEDFQITKGSKGNILSTNIQGFSLILFYSTQCEHCQSLIPIFKQLPGTVGGCQFGMVNVNHNKQCIMMSRETIAPIKVVPYIILYINGKPYMRYQGPHDAKEISRFIVEVSQKVQTRQTFTKQEETKEVKQKLKGGIPAYTIGKPLYGDEDDNVCYLEFNSAYGNTNNSTSNHNKNRSTFPVGSGMN
jgi:thiol-disulfide isomerase/thioredoxin